MPAFGATTLPQQHREPIGAEVKNKIDQVFPGVVIESDIQGWAFLDEFEVGVDKFVEIEEPTPADLRWVGVCYYQLLRDSDALHCLEKAVALGDEGARINLAHLLPFLERGDEASKQLSQIVLDRLTDYDKALFFRVLSLQEENSGNLREALRAAEEAWRRIQGLPEYPVLAPSVLAQPI